MSRVRRWMRLPLFTRRSAEQQVDDEIAFHLAARTARLVALGMSPAAARTESTRRFGQVDAIREECATLERRYTRQSAIEAFVEELRTDVRFGVRSLLRRPGLTLTALLTLVLGTASITTVYSIVNAFWRPLPYPDSDRIVALAQEGRSVGYDQFIGMSLSVAGLVHDETRSFERVSNYRTTYANILAGDAPTQMAVLRVDTAFRGMLGTPAAVGRWLSADEILNDQPVAVISDDLWRTMGGDQSVLNRPLRIEDRLYTVVGVMPPQFGFPNRTKVWRPLAMRPDSGDTPSTTTVAVLGKLRPGVSRAAARRELSALSRRLGGLDPTFARDSVVMRDDMIDRRLRPTAVLMVVTGLGAGLCVLMIVCTSVATLMVARTAERRTEMAVRASLGAGRWRLTRQLLAESLVLSLVAGLLGTLVSVLGVRLVLALVPTRGFPSWLRFGVDARVLAFTIVVTMLVTVLVSTLPVRVATRLDLVSALKNGTSGGGRSSALVLGSRRGLIVQLALSMALFMGTVLMARSYHRVATFDFGYPAERIVSVAPTFDWQRYPTYTSRVELLETVAARVREQSGIATIGVWAPSVTLATRATVDAMAKSPALRREPLWNLRADSGSGRTIPVGSFHVAAIPDHYFDILGVHLVQGRPFSTVDAVGSVPAAIISRTVARTIFGNRNPLGRQLSQSPAGDRFTVVGVAEDVRRPTDAARRAGASNDVYLSIRQTGPGSPELLAQGADVDATKRLLAAALRSADPQLPVPLPQTLDRAADEGLLVTRLFGTGLGFFAASGLLLSIIGIYGVVAFAVTQRTREIGIRLALGGSSSAVVRLLLREGLRFTVPGVVIGLALAAATARVMQRFLIETSAFDPLAYVSAALFFALISTAACYLPGRRAARVDPLVALRSE